MESHHNVVQKQVSTRDYNYRRATEDMNTRVDATRGDATTYGDAYHYADNYLAPEVTMTAIRPGVRGVYARIRHERYLNGQTQTRAITSCPTLSPGQVLKVTGGYEVADVLLMAWLSQPCARMPAAIRTWRLISTGSRTALISVSALSSARAR